MLRSNFVLRASVQNFSDIIAFSGTCLIAKLMTVGMLNDIWMFNSKSYILRDCIQASTVVVGRVGHPQQRNSVSAPHGRIQPSRACSNLALCQVTLESPL